MTLSLFFQEKERKAERERGLKLERMKDLLEDVPNVGTHETVERQKFLEFGVLDKIGEGNMFYI